MGALVLGIDPGDYIMIGDNIKVTFIKRDTHERVRLKIEAPNDINILRKAVYENYVEDVAVFGKQVEVIDDL